MNTRIRQRTHIEVSADGPVVVLQIGTGIARMEYRTALRMSQYLRMAVRQARGNVGEKPKLMGRSVTMMLPDEYHLSLEKQHKGMALTEWLKALKPMQSVARPRSNSKKIGCEVHGEDVALKLGNVTVMMHHTSAEQIAAWLRVKGREAKAFAGDKGKELSVVGTLTNAAR